MQAAVDSGQRAVSDQSESTTSSCDRSSQQNLSRDADLTSASEVSAGAANKERRLPPGSHQCPLCSFKTAEKSSLRGHIRTHTGEVHFNCPSCAYQTAWHSELIMHIRKHTGETPFQCSLCAYKTRIKSSLKRHMRSHTGETPFHCPLCAHKSAYSKQLTIHIQRTHSGETPYQCSHCAYKTCFSEKGSLKRHIRRFHATHQMFAASAVTEDTDNKPDIEEVFSAATAALVEKVAEVAEPAKHPREQDVMKQLEPQQRKRVY